MLGLTESLSHHWISVIIFAVLSSDFTMIFAMIFVMQVFRLEPHKDQRKY